MREIVHKEFCAKYKFKSALRYSRLLKHYDQHHNYVVERNAMIGKKEIVADGYETETKTSSSVRPVSGIVIFVFLTRKFNRFSKKLNLDKNVMQLVMQ